MGKKNKLLKHRTIEIIRGYKVGYEFNISMIISDYKQQWARHTPTTTSLSSVLRSAHISKYIYDLSFACSLEVKRKAAEEQSKKPLTYTRIDEGEEE